MRWDAFIIIIIIIKKLVRFEKLVGQKLILSVKEMLLY